MDPSTCSLGARARILKCEHMLGSLVLGLDAQRVLSEHQRITEWYKMWDKLTLNAEKKVHQTSQLT